MYLTIYSFNSYSLQMSLFPTIPGVALLASQPAWSIVRARLLSHRVLTNTALLGKGNRASFNAQPINPSIGVIEKYHKCIFTFSSLIKCRGSVCGLFNYIHSFPKHFIFHASACTDRSHWPLHLSVN